MYEAGTRVQVWLADTTDRGGSFWVGTISNEERFADAHYAVELAQTGGVIAKVPSRQVFPFPYVA